MQRYNPLLITNTNLNASLTLKDSSIFCCKECANHPARNVPKIFVATHNLLPNLNKLTLITIKEKWFIKPLMDEYNAVVTGLGSRWIGVAKVCLWSDIILGNELPILNKYRGRYWALKNTRQGRLTRAFARNYYLRILIVKQWILKVLDLNNGNIFRKVRALSHFQFPNILNFQ